MPNFGDNARKCLLTIGSEKDVYKSIKGLSDSNKHNVELIGLVPSQAFNKYTIYADCSDGIKKFDIPVDFVARAIDKNGEVQCATQLRMNFDSSVSRSISM